MKENKETGKGSKKVEPAQNKKTETDASTGKNKTGAAAKHQKEDKGTPGTEKVTNKDSKVTNRDEERSVTNKDEENKGEKRNQQRHDLNSDIRNTPDNRGGQETTNIHKKIHKSSFSNDLEQGE